MNKLKPFFSYFGAKHKLSGHYPPPRFNHIIEPFAGSAGYSHLYYSHKIELYDVDPVIFGVWDYLIRSNKSDILALPIDIDKIENLTQEAKWLIGFWTGRGMSKPQFKESSWMKKGIYSRSFWGSYIRERIANQVECIKHWKVYQKSYADIPFSCSTYFIDPPYIKAGKKYSCHTIDYTHLSAWCLSRTGQVIVCEQTNANWLPFRLFKKHRSIGHTTTEEAIFIK